MSDRTDAGWVDVHFAALQDCAGQAKKVAGTIGLDAAFSETEHRAPKGSVSPDTFGTLSNSGGLATQVDAVWDALTKDLHFAKVRLEDVERSLDKVEINLRSATKASGG